MRVVRPLWPSGMDRTPDAQRGNSHAPPRLKCPALHVCPDGLASPFQRYLPFILCHRRRRDSDSDGVITLFGNGLCSGEEARPPAKRAARQTERPRVCLCNGSNQAITILHFIQRSDGCLHPPNPSNLCDDLALHQPRICGGSSFQRLLRDEELSTWPLPEHQSKPGLIVLERQV